MTVNHFTYKANLSEKDSFEIDGQFLSLFNGLNHASKQHSQYQPPAQGIINQGGTHPPIGGYCRDQSLA
ncbi:MAG: hypothetical protein ABJQ70_09825 [Roseobacter sp.]